MNYTNISVKSISYIGRLIKISCVTLCWMIATPIYANESSSKPLWEWALAGGSVYIPDYPGSDEYRARSLVFPFFIYRGDVFRIGDGKAAGVFVETDLIEFDISFAGGFNANSRGNKARQGMPDLDYLGEVGPQLIIKLFNDSNKKLELNLPLRAVFSSDFKSIDHRGWIFNPKLRYEHKGWLMQALNLVLSANTQFTTREVQGYFYDVDAQYATASRPAYRAKEGYFSTGLSALVSGNITERVLLFGGFGGTYYGGGANEDNALLKAKTTGTLGAGFRWSFYIP